MEIINLEPHLLATLPPERYEMECADSSFLSCNHWVHGTRSPEGNAILSLEFSSFLKARGN